MEYGEERITGIHDRLKNIDVRIGKIIEENLAQAGMLVADVKTYPVEDNPSAMELHSLFIIREQLWMELGRLYDIKSNYFKISFTVK
jgi:hypothetical protein